MSATAVATMAAPGAFAPARPFRLFGSFRLLPAWLVAAQYFNVGLARLPPGHVAIMAFVVMSGFIILEVRAASCRDRPVAFPLNRNLRIGPPFLAAAGLSMPVHSMQQGGSGRTACTLRNLPAHVLGSPPGHGGS